MADSVTLKAILTGEDRSMSKTMDKAGNSVENVGKKASGAGAVLKGALSADLFMRAADAVVEFGRESVEAYQEAERSQRALQDAYRRFPALANVRIAKLREEAAAIERKNGADADDIAAGQAVLARYKLTGQQLQKMTPLLVDYAVRTGKDIPDAAKALGKALGGSTRLSKELGFEFTNSKKKGANFQQVMKGLRGTVGGYADKEAKTAAGQSKILNTRLGNLQETIGEKLNPAMQRMNERGNDMLDWLERNPESIDGFADGLNNLNDGLDVVGEGFTGFMLLAWGATEKVANGFADLFDVLGMVPGFDWARNASKNLRGVANEARKAQAGLISIGKQKVIVETAPAKKRVDELKKKINSIKGKIVEAKAKGDDKAVVNLKRKLDSLRKQYNIAMNVYKTGISTIRAVPFAGGLSVRAVAMGGGVKSGMPYWVGENGPELFWPGMSGHINNQFQLQNAMKGGPAANGAVTNYYVTLNTPAGAPNAWAAEAEQALVKLMKSRGPGGTLKFQTAPAQRR